MIAVGWEGDNEGLCSYKKSVSNKEHTRSQACMDIHSFELLIYTPEFLNFSRGCRTSRV
jgi:hypothetical protein